MGIIQDTLLNYTHNLNIENDFFIDKIESFRDELYTNEIKEYLLINIDYIRKYKKIPLLNTNTSEFNKQVFKIKLLLEKYISEK